MQHGVVCAHCLVIKWIAIAGGWRRCWLVTIPVDGSAGPRLLLLAGRWLGGADHVRKLVDNVARFGALGFAGVVV